jgi:plasmid stabilization system protein ParE
MPKSKPPRRRKIRRGNELRVLMLEGVQAALALNDAILAKIDDSLSRTPKGPNRTALLTWRAEMKSHRPGLIESRADAMRPD